MYFNKLAMVVTATMLASTTTAQAQDWNGSYFGGFLGYGAGSYDLDTTTSGFFGPTVDVDGAMLGLRYGRDSQNGNSVWGFDVSLSNGPDGTLPVGTSAGGVTCATGQCNVSINAMATVRGRYGYVFNGGQTLGYGALGLAVAGVDGGIFNSVQQGSSTAVGYTLGVGLEHMLSGNLSLFGEINYVDLGDLEFGIGTGPTDGFIGDGSFSTAIIGVNYRF